MFAIALWDERHEKLICVRDHLGVRPLFYAHTNDVFIFGSDIDALLAHPKVSEELNEEFETLKAEARELEERIAENMVKFLEGE